MQANPPKRHKRSASSAAATPSVAKPRFKKPSDKLHSNFQAPSKPRIELKNFDLATASLPATLPSPATATGVLLNAYNAGTSAITATGRRVLNKSLLLRLMIYPGNNTAAGVAATGCRVAVVYDREANGAAPAITDVWGTGAAQGSCAAANLDNCERFRVLLDEKFSFAQQAFATAAGLVTLDKPYFLERYVKMSLESVAKSNGFSAAIAGIATGSIYLFCWSDTAAANNPPQVLSGLSRIRFQDG